MTLLVQVEAEEGGLRGERWEQGRCRTPGVNEGSVGNSAERGEWAESDQPTRPRDMPGGGVLRYSSSRLLSTRAVGSTSWRTYESRK